MLQLSIDEQVVQVENAKKCAILLPLCIRCSMCGLVKLRIRGESRQNRIRIRPDSIAAIDYFTLNIS